MHSIYYKNKKINFTPTRKKVKNINLRVKPNQEVLVSTNKYVPLDYIKRFLSSKAGWIDKHLEDFKQKEKLMDNWYKERSKTIIKDSLNRMYDLVKPYGIEYPDLGIRKMKSRWGSCYTERKSNIDSSKLRVT